MYVCNGCVQNADKGRDTRKVGQREENKHVKSARTEGAQGVIIRMAQTTVRYRFTWCFCENNGFLIGRDGGFQKNTVFLQHGFDYIVRARARPEPATEKLKKHVWF